MENTINLDGLILPYRIEYKRTRILKMRLKEGTICIVAPYYTSVQQIQELVFKHKKYLQRMYRQYQISKQKDQIAEFDVLTILGQKYQILFTHTASKISGHYLFLKKQDATMMKKEIKKLFLPLQYQLFYDLTKKYFQQMNLPFSFPQIQIKDVRSRWGSYRKDQHLITYSSNLIFKPIVVYDYIVVHELAHLLQFNHSFQFYQIVQTFCPNYKECIKILKDVTL